MRMRLLLIWVAPWLVAYISASAQTTTWVYPRHRMLVSTIDSLLVIGRTKIPGRLTIEGQEIPLDIEGGFANYVALDLSKAGCDSSYTLTAIWTDGVSADTTKRTITLPLPRSEWTTLSFDPQYLVPGQEIVLKEGDRIPLACRTMSGQRVFYSITDERGTRLTEPFLMNEEEPGILSDFGNAFFGFESRSKRKPTPGIYSASVSIQKGWKSAKVRFFMVQGRDTIRITAPGTLSAQQDPTYVRMGPPPNNAMAAPGRSYYYFLPEGTVCAVTGRIGRTVRLQLSEHHSAWIADSQTLPLVHASVTSTIPVIRIRSTEHETMIRLFMSSPLPFHVEQPDPRTLELRVFGGIADVDWIRPDHPDSRIETVTWSQPEDDVFAVRVTFRYEHSWGYRVTHDSLGMVWTLRHPPTNKSLKGLTICIDPGHSPDVGATGPYGAQEHQANLLVARKLSEELKRQGATVIMTRNDTVSRLSLYDRVAIANQARADLFVSIHHNAQPDGVNPNAQPAGPMTIYYHFHSRALAEEIQKEMIKRTRLPDFGVFMGNIAVCRNSEMPAVLVECAFLTLPEQERLIRQEKFQTQMAKSIADGIKNFVKRSAYRE